jgi:hypothetical protein
LAVMLEGLRGTLLGNPIPRLGIWINNANQIDLVNRVQQPCMNTPKMTRANDRTP